MGKNKKKRLVVFSGAGISAESGVPTFRSGKDATWANVKIEDVATTQAWQVNRANMLDFYNKRRNELDNVEPNAAHIKLAELEEYFDVTIVTQNIDDLHERGGSTNVLHLHGELRKMREEADPDTLLDYDKDIKEGDLGPEGSQLRPHVVWFGEDPQHMSEAWHVVSKADYLIIVGTSLEVAPACFIPGVVKEKCIIYQVNPHLVPVDSDAEVFNISKPATKGISEVADILLEK